MEYGFSDLLTEYADRSDRYPFNMPGHKRRSFQEVSKMLVDHELIEATACPDIPEWISRMYYYDVTEVEDLDDLNHPEESLLHLQKMVRASYGSKDSFLMVNGSSGGLLAAIEATTSIGDEILIARNCHTSVYREIIHRGLRPKYIFPRMNEEMCIFEGISADDVDHMLQENPKIKVVVIVSPTYEGVLSDLEAIANTVHKYGSILIVDEAHGAHFPFTDRYTSGIAYADLVVQSLHKTLPSPTQTAVIHRMSDRVDKDRLRRSVNYVQSTSPSYLLVAGMDACMRYMQAVGRPLMEFMYQRLEWFYQQVTALTELRFYNGPDKDLSKLVFGSRYDVMDGGQIADWLRDHAGIESEMCSLYYVLLMVTAFDGEDALLKLLSSLQQLNEELKKRGSKIIRGSLGFGRLDYSLPKQLMTPYEALWSLSTGYETAEVLVSEALGNIAGETIFVYPPGIPILVAGEQIEEKELLVISEYVRHNFRVHGLTNKMCIPVIRPKK